MRKVIFHYLKISLSVGINFGFACIVARFLLKCYPRITEGQFTSFLLLIGTASLLTAGIGKLGWHSGITSYKGKAKPEKLNNAIFYTLSQLGAFCIFLDLMLQPSGN